LHFAPEQTFTNCSETRKTWITQRPICFRHWLTLKQTFATCLWG
jgi:hypothetical protein